MKRAFVAVAVMVTATLSGGIAHAAWLSADGSGNALAKATSVGGGNTPTASASGSSVTVSWDASTLVGGAAVSGYEVKRYDAVTNALQTIGAGCFGTITALTCTETGVAVGTWKYSVTPIRDNWRGAESDKSNSVTVAAADATAPTATITFPANGSNYNASEFTAGCGTAATNDLCGSASDTTGVQTVKVSIQQGSGDYWNGSSFASATEVFTNATLASPLGTSTTWSLPVTLSTKSSYTVRVQTVDTLTNTQAAGTYAATTTFNYVATITASLDSVGQGQNPNKVKASGTTDLAHTTAFPVYLCLSSAAPCTSSNATATLSGSVGPNGTWTTGNSNALSNGTYQARVSYTDFGVTINVDTEEVIIS